MATIKKGDELMLFIDGQSVAFATSHTLSITAETSSITSKDHGVWAGNDVNTVSWEMSSENIYTEQFDTLFDVMTARQPIKVWMGLRNENHAPLTADLDSTYTYWTPNSTAQGYWGQAVLTSLSMNANCGETATFSATFTGTGPLEAAVYSSSMVNSPSVM